MKHRGQDVLPSGLANLDHRRVSNPFYAVYRFIDDVLTITEVEVRKLRHDPTDLFTRAIQPILWLLLFGEVFSRIRAIPTGGLPYLDFMSPGILAQSVLFIAIFYGIAIIWERDLGIVHKLLASPASRTAVVLGKATAAGVRGLTQGIIIYVLAVLLGVKINWNPLALLGVVAMVIMAAALFSTFSLVIACLIKTRERFMGIAQVLTMPMFFASNAIYPISIMPTWLKVISHGNPLSYEVDALRTLMVASGSSLYGLGVDFVVLLAITAVLVIIGGKVYPNVAT